ncbi:hypothetical protein [Lactobacillus sp.]|uniref:hypothetical protein n=1 Tax=Lactobacillus sp. TaxID=1591 RepID=UPI00258753E8|nr:hypothetical protein [Lactobacillus sp.]MCO6529052.1 hypothetical protein [Lactobacillus sp.]
MTVDSFETATSIIDLAIIKLQDAKTQLSYADDNNAQYSLLIAKKILNSIKFENDEYTIFDNDEAVDQKQVDKELITKIAKMVTYISNTNDEIKTSRETYPDSKIGRSIAINELMLLIIKVLGTNPELKWPNTVFDRSHSSESDYDIQNARALVELYDKICNHSERHGHE